MGRYETYIFLDIEATLIYGKQHVIEIGAIKWLPNDSIETFEQLIKPRKFKRLNHHIHKLTGITTEEILHAPPFPKVMNEFIEWCKGDVVFVTFGEFDRKVLEEEFHRNHMDCSVIYPIVDYQQKYMIEKQMKDQPSLSGVMDSLDLKNETHHRALADAFSLYQIFRVSNGIEMIEMQKTNEFVILLSEVSQQESFYELTLSYISGSITAENINIFNIKTIKKELEYITREVERSTNDGEIQKAQVNDIQPNCEVYEFINQISDELKDRVLITRTGLRQISKVFKLHQCQIPKTEVMTLQQLIKNEDIVCCFTLEGQSIPLYEEKIVNLIRSNQNLIIEEFFKRNLFKNEEVFI